MLKWAMTTPLLPVFPANHSDQLAGSSLGLRLNPVTILARLVFQYQASCDAGPT